MSCRSDTRFMHITRYLADPDPWDLDSIRFSVPVWSASMLTTWTFILCFRHLIYCQQKLPWMLPFFFLATWQYRSGIFGLYAYSCYMLWLFYSHVSYTVWLKVARTISYQNKLLIVKCIHHSVAIKQLYRTTEIAQTCKLLTLQMTDVLRCSVSFLAIQMHLKVLGQCHSCLFLFVQDMFIYNIYSR